MIKIKQMAKISEPAQACDREIKEMSSPLTSGMHTNGHLCYCLGWQLFSTCYCVENDFNNTSNREK